MSSHRNFFFFFLFTFLILLLLRCSDRNERDESRGSGRSSERPSGGRGRSTEVLTLFLLSIAWPERGSCSTLKLFQGCDRFACTTRSLCMC